jgi:spore germination cell wall hydrolase CwlJ-like protein
MYVYYRWNIFFILLVVSLLFFINYKPSTVEPTVQEIVNSIPDPVVIKKAINTEHLHCLANNIYHEAAGEPFMGQVAVARVVMNRIKHGFANNPCRVIYQATVVPDPENLEETRKICQFSWVCAGKTSPSKNNPKYQIALDIATKILEEDKWSEDIPNNILFFHNTGVNPLWKYHQSMIIGNHVFYSRGKEKT